MLNLEQNWSSPENLQFDATYADRRLFSVTSFKAPSPHTEVFALVGAGTAFTDFERHSGKNRIDCPSDAILLIDCKNDSIHWMQPGDIELADLVASKRNEGIGDLQPNYPEGFLVAFVDGAVWCVKRDVPWDVISKFVTVESAEKYDREVELGPYALERVPPLPKDDQGQYTFEPVDLTK
jgi:hypothetical protein